MGLLIGKNPIPGDIGSKVLVCGAGPCYDTPSVSPFDLKLQTFLRMAEIEYQGGKFYGFSSKEKIPWIIHQDETVEDSDFCIDYLKHRFDCDPDKNLTTEQKAIARAICKMTEDSLYWTLALFRFRYTSAYPDDTIKRYFLTDKPSVFQRLLLSNLSRRVCKETWGQGIGRHAEGEVKVILEGDLRALSDALGEKPFFMGNDPTQVDCVVFGMLGSMVQWGAHEKNPANIYLKENCKNLENFCYRMKERFWPDWDERLAKFKDSSSGAD